MKAMESRLETLVEEGKYNIDQSSAGKAFPTMKTWIRWTPSLDFDEMLSGKQIGNARTWRRLLIEAQLEAGQLSGTAIFVGI